MLRLIPSSPEAADHVDARLAERRAQAQGIQQAKSAARGRRRMVRVLLDRYGLPPLEWWETTRSAVRRLDATCFPHPLRVTECVGMTEDEFMRHPRRPAAVSWFAAQLAVRGEVQARRVARAGWRHATPIAATFAIALAVLVVWSVR